MIKNIKRLHELSKGEPPIDPSLDLIRRTCGSISVRDLLADITELEHLRSEASTIASKPLFKEELERMIAKQLEWMNMETANWEQVIFGRGTVNGIRLILEHFETLHNDHVAATKPPETFDRFNPMPEHEETD